MFKTNKDGKIKTNKLGMYIPNWNSKYYDKHRRGVSDVDWAKKQPNIPAKYVEGDIIEFVAGGFGFIRDIYISNNGPTQYSTGCVSGKPYHPKNKNAWHYELDIKKLIIKSSLRTI